MRAAPLLQGAGLRGYGYLLLNPQMSEQRDLRRIVRGKCLLCDFCSKYAAPPGAGLKCKVCSHPPGKHERMKDTSGSETIDVCVAPSLTAAQESGGEEDTLASSVTRCTVKDCDKPVDFDPNTGDERNFCEEHAGYISAQSGEKSMGNASIWDIELSVTSYQKRV